MRTLVIVGWLLSLAVTRALAQEKAPAKADPQLADQAYAVFKARCYRCHGGASQNAGLNVLALDSLLRSHGSGKDVFHFVVPGQVDKSTLWNAVESSYMPQDGSAESKAMTADERQLLKRWIHSGAPFPKRRQIRFVSDRDMLAGIRDFLLKAPPDDRPYLKFYTFTHLYNNEDATDLDLRLYRAALAKGVNSLSWQRELVLPQAIPNTQETILMIDLRKLGWDRRNLWLEVLKHYPYGLKYDYVKDRELQQLARDVALLSGGELPYLRADWFVVTASQPPLYHVLLDIPQQLSELERQLGIDFEANFKRGELARAGFAKSGVSKQNRLIERHTSGNTPYYWISYDFKPRKAKGDLVRFPLGPRFTGNPYQNFAFAHDGGEVIFSLPNGMQAYMLTKGDGTRIDEGPVDVVFDRSAILGSPGIINGISCMNCHRHGMISEFNDEIRGADALAGDAAKHVEQLYPSHDHMASLVAQDRDVFMRALGRIVGPSLQVGDDQQKTLDSFPEPVGRVAELYARDLTRREVALELGLANIETLRAKIEANRELLKLGLGTLLQEPPGTIKREKWETVDGTSLFQDVAVELRLGTPTVFGSVTGGAGR